MLKFLKKPKKHRAATDGAVDDVGSFVSELSSMEAASPGSAASPAEYILPSARSVEARKGGSSRPLEIPKPQQKAIAPSATVDVVKQPTPQAGPQIVRVMEHFIPTVALSRISGDSSTNLIAGVEAAIKPEGLSDRNVSQISRLSPAREACSYEPDDGSDEEDDATTVAGGAIKKKGGGYFKVPKALRGKKSSKTNQKDVPGSQLSPASGRSGSKGPPAGQVINKDSMSTTARIDDLQLLRSEMTKLKAANEELTQFLEARTFSLRKTEEAREDDCAAHLKEIEAMQNQLDLSKNQVEQLQKLETVPKNDLNNRLHNIDELSAKNQGLSTRNAELEAEVIKQSRVLEDISLQNTRLSRHVEQLTTKLSDSQAIGKTQTGAAIELLNDENSRLTKLLAETSDREAALQSAISQKEQAMQKISSEASEKEMFSSGMLEEEVNRLRNTVEKLSDETGKLQRLLQDAETEKHQLSIDGDEMREKLKRLAKQTELEEDEKIRHLRQHMEELQEEIDALYSQLSNSAKQNTNLMDVINELRDENLKLQDAADVVQSKQSAVEQELDKKELASELSRSEMAFFRQRAVELENELSKRSDAMEEIKQEISQLKSRNSAIEDQKEHLERECHSLQEQIKAIKVYIAEETKTAVDDKGMDSARERLVQLEGDNAALKAEAQARSADLMRMEDIKNNLTLQLTEITAKHDQLEKLVKSLTTARDDLQQQLKLVEAESIATSRSLNLFRNSLTETTEKLKLADRAKENGNLIMIKLKADSETTVSLLEQRSKELASSRAAVSDLEAQLTAQKTALAAAEAETSQAKTKLSRFQADHSAHLVLIQRERTDALTAEKERVAVLETQLEKVNKETGERAATAAAEAMKLQQKLENEVQQLQAELKQNRVEYDMQLNSAACVTTNKQTALVAERDALRTRLEEAEYQVSSLQLSVHEAKLNLSSTLTQTKYLETEHEALQRAHQVAKEKLIAATELSSVLTNDVSQKEQAQQLQILELQGAIQLKDMKIKTLTDTEAYLKSEVANTSTQLDALHTTRNKLTSQVGTLQARVNELEVNAAKINSSSQLRGNATEEIVCRELREAESQIEFLKNMLTEERKRIADAEKLRLNTSAEHSAATEYKDVLDMLSERTKVIVECITSEKATKAATPTDKQQLTKDGVPSMLCHIRSNVIVSGLPDCVMALPGDDSSANVKRTSIVTILKSRLIDCLFELPNQGDLQLPSSIFNKQLHRSSTVQRPMAARVLSRVARLWDLSEDLRLGMVQIDPALSNRYMQTKTSNSGWTETLENLRGAAQTLEERNKKLETLCNTYVYSVKEARATAGVDREKYKAVASSLRKKLQHLGEKVDATDRVNAELRAQVHRLKQALDVAITENKQLEDGTNKYFTSIPYVKSSGLLPSSGVTGSTVVIAPQTPTLTARIQESSFPPETPADTWVRRRIGSLDRRERDNQCHTDYALSKHMSNRTPGSNATTMNTIVSSQQHQLGDPGSWNTPPFQQQKRASGTGATRSVSPLRLSPLELHE